MEKYVAGQEVEEVAARILQYVTENGRVQNGEGGFNSASVEAEVEFQAREEGYKNSDEIAEAAVGLLGAGPFK